MLNLMDHANNLKIIKGICFSISGSWYLGAKRQKYVNMANFLQDGNEVFFRIKRSTQLKKLMNAYCDRQSVDLNSIAFLFDGRRLRGEQTPDEVCYFSQLCPSAHKYDFDSLWKGKRVFPYKHQNM